MECNFVAGQKVVYISDGPPPGSLGDVLGMIRLVRGNIYTIRFISIDYQDGSAVLEVEEIPPQSVIHHGRLLRLCYCADDFRPLTDRKTDIEVFQQIRRDVEKTARKPVDA